MDTLGCDTGHVVALENEFAVVEFEENDACKGCGARAICAPGDAKKRLRVLNSLDVEIGDQVALELDHSKHLAMASMHYGLPLVGFVLGVLMGAVLIKEERYGCPAELWQFLCGAVMLVLCGFVAHWWSNRLSGTQPEFAQMKHKF